MSKCIYSQLELNNDQPPNSATASLEHIIPWALGGSNGFTTRDVSRSANNDLGSKVDAPFINTLPIALKRHQLCLESQNGNIPPITWSASALDGARATIIISADKTLEVRFTPNVERDGDNGQTSIKGTRETVQPIIEGMLAKSRKRGERLYSTDGVLLESLEDFWSKSEPVVIEGVTAEIEFFNHEAWTRGIAKIALAAAHHILGSKWTFGPDGDVLRNIVANDKSDWPILPRGFIAGQWDRSVRLAAGKTAAVKDAHEHTICVFPSRPGTSAVIAISLFGGNGVPEAFFHIGKLPAHFVSRLNSSDFPQTLMGYRVNPSTRAAHPILFDEIDKRIASQGPTKSRTPKSMYFV